MNKLKYRITTITCFLIAIITLFLPSFRMTGIWTENISLFDFIRGYQVPFGVREDMQNVDIAMYGIQVILIGMILCILISTVFLIINKYIMVVFILQILSSLIALLLMVVALIVGVYLRSLGNFVGISLHVGSFVLLLALILATVFAYLSRAPKPKPTSIPSPKRWGY